MKSKEKLLKKQKKYRSVKMQFSLKDNGRKFDIIDKDNKEEFSLCGNETNLSEKQEEENKENLSEENEDWLLKIENPNLMSYICNGLSEKEKRWQNLNTFKKNINYYGKKNPLCEKRVRSLIITGKKKKEWNKINKKQKGVKLFFSLKKDWELDITKASNLFFEQEDEGIILNDDYNTINENELLMRPVQATILKVHDEDSSSSVSSYDFLQYIKTKHLVQKTELSRVNKDDIYQNVINRTKLINSNYNQTYNEVNNQNIQQKNIYTVVEENIPINYNNSNEQISEKVIVKEKNSLSGSEVLKKKIKNPTFDYARVFESNYSVENKGGKNVVSKEVRREEQSKVVKKALKNEKKIKKIEFFEDDESEGKHYLKI